MIENRYILHSVVVLSLLFCPALKGKNVWILIHGTFAQEAAKVITRTGWWKPEHTFHQELLASTNNATIHAFNWCGSNSHEKRIDAGKELADFIESTASSNEDIHIIGHSHGANVGILGAQELVKRKSSFKVSTLFSLGVPVSNAYNPEQLHITKVYNLFSYADFVQPVMGLFARVFSEHPHIYNLQVKINGICPNHYSIHDPIIARYLPIMHTMIPSSDPYAIHFFNNKKPVVERDLTREQDLRIDKNFTNSLIASFAESKKYGCKTFTELSEQTKARILRFWNRRALNSKAMPESKS
jgi:predicted esterase